MQSKRYTLFFFMTIAILTLLLAAGAYSPAEAGSKQGNGHGKEQGKGHGGGRHWTYEGETGPAHWGELSPDYAACSKGKRQSPVDIANPVEAELPALKFNYKKSRELAVLNNGHAIQVNASKGNTLKAGKSEFELLQFHFHSPSEHTLNGKYYAMEVHFVHKDGAGNLAVVGAFIEEGKHNAAYDKIWRHMPKEAGKKKILLTSYNTPELLPKNKDYYRYPGSLTTPPCTESVTWLVLKTPIQLSKKQIDEYRAVLNHTNRPVQPLNNRLILEKD